MKVLVMYPKGESFDLDYYLQKHMPLVRERWKSMGLKNTQILKGTGAGDGSEAPYQVIAELDWESPKHFQEAAAKHGPELFGDIPNFTKAQPVVQINDVAEGVK